jgi:hypothetical protein
MLPPSMATRELQLRAIRLSTASADGCLSSPAATSVARSERLSGDACAEVRRQAGLVV